MKDWEVHWTKENGEIWFEKGWKKFVKNYSLRHGHFVLFKYGGTSQIDVIILEPSALEIEYLCSDCDGEIGTLNQSNDESVKITKVEHNATPTLPLVSSRTRSRKKMRNGTNGNLKRNFKLQKMDVDAGVPSDQLMTQKMDVDAGIPSYQKKKFQKIIKHQPKGIFVVRRICEECMELN